MENNRCLDCGKTIHRLSTRCCSCSKKFFYKENPERKFDITKNVDYTSFWGAKNPNYKGGKTLNRTCPDCGVKIGKTNKRCKKCAIVYQSKTYKGINHPSWEGGLVYKKCVVCNKDFPVVKSTFSLRKTCSKECFGFYMSITNSGENNKQWLGGGKEKYPFGWDEFFREQVRNRDNFKCQLCGKPEIENMRKLNVHHIDYDKNNIKMNNLISLCVGCHAKTNYNREHWKKTFSRSKEEFSERVPIPE